MYIVLNNTLQICYFFENILCTFPSKNPISAFDLSHCNRNVNGYIVYLQLKFKLFLFMCIGHLPLTSYLWSFFILISAYALLLHVLLTFKYASVMS